MIVAVLLLQLISISEGGLPCTLDCRSTWVLITQRGDGECDLECNNPLCGFDRDIQKGNDCTSNCINTGCTLSLLGNGHCDDECKGAACGYDDGDCGYCAVGCFRPMLENRVCDLPCNVEKCGFDGGMCAVCAENCRAELLGDGVCQESCNLASCDFDKGDCQKCSEHCLLSNIGDGNCSIDCYTDACSFDGGDCAGKTIEGCEVANIGNKVCNEECYSQAAGWDGGDCDCAPGCTHDLYSNSKCDEKCNSSVCQWDNFQCVRVTQGKCASGCVASMLGNGVCDEKCNSLECLYDKGDCECHPGCSISDFQSCKAECLNYACGYANYGKENGCNDPYLLELALVSQALNKDFFAVFNWTTCLAAEPECTSEKLRALWSSEECYSIGRGNKVEGTCSTQDCAYALGALTLVTAPSCIRGYGRTNNECFQCLASSKRLHSMCLPSCPNRYQPNEVFPEFCTPRVDNSTAASPDIKYTLQSKFEGEGTLDRPFGSLGYAVTAMWQKYSSMYLLGDRVLLKFYTSSSSANVLAFTAVSDPLNAANFSRLWVSSYTCSEHWSEYCSNRYTEIDIVQPFPMMIGFSMEFYRVIFTSSRVFEGLSVYYCPYLEFQNGAWKDGMGGSAPQNYVTASKLCDQFKDYSVFHVQPGGQLRLEVKSTQEVIVANLTIQPKAFIQIEGGDARLENVTFTFVHTQRRGTTSGVVLQAGDCGNTTCGTFQFLHGRVEYLNNAVGVLPGLSLSPFLHGSNLHSVTIDEVAFVYNFAVNYDTNVGVISNSAIIYLENFYLFSVTNSMFGQGLTSGGQIVIYSLVTLPRTPFADRLEAIWFQKRHILFENITFDSLIGEHSLIHVKFVQDVLNVEVRNLTFSNSGIFGNTVVNFETEQETTDEIANGKFEEVYNSKTQVKDKIWLAPRSITISDCHFLNIKSFSTLLFLGILANIRLTDIDISSSGNVPDNSLSQIYKSGFIANPKVINMKNPPLPGNTPCLNYIWADGSTNIIISTLKAEGNHCTSGSCGVKITGNNGFTLLSDYLSQDNQCTGLAGLAIDCPGFVNITMTKLTFRKNTNLAGEMGRFDYGSYVTMTDSAFTDNTGVFGSCFYFSSVQSFMSSGVVYQRNKSVASRGGALYWLVGNLLPVVIAIQNSVFDSNSAVSGGGLAIDAINATTVYLAVNNCTFLQNEASMYGAGMLLGLFVTFQPGSIINKSTFTQHNSSYAVLYLTYSGGVLIINDCSFVENVGSQTSAIFIQSEPPTVTVIRNILFLRNKKSPVILKSNLHTVCTFTTENCWYEDNDLSAVVTEGAIFSDTNSTYLNSKDSAVIISGKSMGRIEHALFRSQYTAASGGGVRLQTQSALECTNSQFINNFAYVHGGAVFAEQESFVVLKNATFRNNTCGSCGSVLFVISGQMSPSMIDSAVMEYNNGMEYGTLFVQSSICFVNNVTMRYNQGGTSTGIATLLAMVVLQNSELSDMKISKTTYVLMFRSTVIIQNTGFRDGEVSVGGFFSIFLSSKLSIYNTTFARVKTSVGGVISAFSDSSVTMALVNMQEIESLAGGSLLLSSESSVAISYSTFRDYSLTGISGYSVGSLNITYSQFVSGRGENGAALYCYNCKSLQIHDSLFQEQTAGSGGAVFLDDVAGVASGTVNITGCRFVDNSAMDAGGAMYINNFQAEITSGEFLRNSATSGGALELACSLPSVCSFSLSALAFANNTAVVKGGAITWTTVKPATDSLLFSSNSAQYGNDIASFPISLAFEEPTRERRTAEESLPTGPEVAPGQVVNFALRASLRDHYNQTINIDNDSTCTIESSGDSSVSGTIKVTASSGTFTFDNFIVYVQPNSSVQLSMTSPAISSKQEGDPDAHSPTLRISAQARDCVPGESKSTESCTVCPPGTYSFQPEIPCKTCPANTDCLGNVTMVPRSGYWRSSNLSEIVRECPNSGACLGGEVDNETLSLTGICAQGYKGNLCQSCSFEYSRTGKNKCGKCPPREVNIVRLTFIGIAVLLVLIVMVWSTLRSATRKTATHSVMIRIFVNYMQLVLIVTDFKLSWPRPVLQLFEAQESAGGVTEQAYSVDCFLAGGKTGSDSYFRKMQFMAVLPVPLIIAALLFWGIVALRKRKPKIMKRDGAATVIIIFFLLLPNLVKSMFSMFSCTEIEKGEFWLTIDMDIRCWNSTHTTNIFAVAIPSIAVWIVAFPCICLGVLVKFKRRHDEMWIKLQYGFLINGYQRSRYYWEFVILYRKILVICCSVFLNNSIAVQALTVQLVLITSCVLQYKFVPYTTAQLNSLEMWGILVADVTIYCGLYYLTEDVSKEMSWTLFIVITSINVLYVVYWLTGLLGYFLRVAKRNNPFLRTLLHSGQVLDDYIEEFIESVPEPDFPVKFAQMKLSDLYRAMLAKNLPDIDLRGKRYMPRMVADIVTSVDLSRRPTSFGPQK